MSNQQHCIDRFVQTLAERGLKHAIIAPGSRNAPIINALSRLNSIELLSVVDERSAGFKALGMALATQKPVAMVCTSGSAAVNFYPAITEAFYQGVPLIVITADRPSELIDRWDGQAIRQHQVFQNHVVSSFTTPEKYEEPNPFIEIAAQAFDKAFDGFKGPVHVNIPLAEPLYAHKVLPPIDFDCRALVTPSAKSDDLPLELSDAIAKAKHPMLLIGHRKPGHQENFDVAKFANNGWTVLADVASQFAASQPHPFWENLLFNELNLRHPSLNPDLLITSGSSILSKKLRSQLRNIGNFKHFHVDESGFASDPFFSKPQVLKMPLHVLSNLYQEETKAPAIPAAINDKVIAALLNLDYGEFAAVVQLFNLIDEETAIHLANSMAVRYAAYAMPRLYTSQVYANRGVSGIDGCLSTAIGAAMADKGHIHFAVIGDLAFFYDSNALWQEVLPNNLRILLLNNGGGGIFDILEGPAVQKSAYPFQITTHHRSAVNICLDYGVVYRMAENQTDLQEGLHWLTNDRGGCRLLEVFSDIKSNTQIFKAYKESINELKIPMD